jgi:hypothetical protein
MNKIYYRITARIDLKNLPKSRIGRSLLEAFNVEQISKIPYILFKLVNKRYGEENILFGLVFDPWWNTGGAIEMLGTTIRLLISEEEDRLHSNHQFLNDYKCFRSNIDIINDKAGAGPTEDYSIEKWLNKTYNDWDKYHYTEEELSHIKDLLSLFKYDNIKV